MPTPRPAGRPARRPKARARGVARLERDLLAALEAAQRRARPPAGLVQCPRCGTPVEPTRTKRVRVHVNPLLAARCPASGAAWAEYGVRPPAPRPAARASRRPASLATRSTRAEARGGAAARRQRPASRRGPRRA